MKSRQKAAAFAAAVSVLLGAMPAGAAASELGEISEGMFSWLTVQAYNAACSINGGTEELWENGIEGKDTGEWIWDTAVEYAKEFIAVEQKFDEAELKLRAEEEETIEDTVERYWNELGYGRYYTEYGVSEEDFRESLAHSTKISILYSEERRELQDSVTDEDISAYIEENGNLVQYIAVPHSAGMSGEMTEEEKAEWLDTDAVYEEYKARLEEGESLESLMEEISGNEKQLAAGIGSSYENGVTETLFLADNTSLSAGFKAALTEAAVDEIVYFDDVAQDYQIIFCKKTFTPDWAGLDNDRDSISGIIASERFAAKMRTWGEQIELENAEELPDAAEIEALFVQ